MSIGPIDFLGEKRSEYYPATEFGGGSGIVQPDVTPLGTPGHIDAMLTSGEKLGLVHRAVEVDQGGTVALVDPITQRAITDTGEVVKA